jgi:lipoprotein-anchoring transpeptidase ErfK/SrfK
VGNRPTISATPTVSAPTTPSTKAAAAPKVRADLADHLLRVFDAQGKTVKTLQITGGSRTHPTPTGTFAVTDKEPSVAISSVMPGMDTYSMRVYSYIALGTDGPLIFGAPWRQSSQFGNDNVSHGAIELAADDATWLYNHLAIGDAVQIMAGPVQ